METGSLIKEARAFHAKKRLGQHFLIDETALARIAALLDLRDTDTVVEIGPGLGFLTRLLAGSGAKITAVELDRESVAYLEELGFANLTVCHGDFLRFDLGCLQFFPGRDPSTVSDGADSPLHLKVVGNVPYQITGRIIGHILGEIAQPAPWLSAIDTVVLTVQREVALRMVAQAGGKDYSRLSLLIAYFCHASLEETLGPASFYPSPSVTSAVVKLKVLKETPVDCRNHTLLRQLIQAGFRQRRKMLRNSLSFLGLTPVELDGVFSALNLDPQVRAERLSLAQFAMLADALTLRSKEDAHATSPLAGEAQFDI